MPIIEAPFSIHVSNTMPLYRTHAIIDRSRFEAALVYKPRILGLENEEFTFFVDMYIVCNIS